MNWGKKERTKREGVVAGVVDVAAGDCDEEAAELVLGRTHLGERADVAVVEGLEVRQEDDVLLVHLADFFRVNHSKNDVQ